jgi:hypothetical protein
VLTRISPPVRRAELLNIGRFANLDCQARVATFHHGAHSVNARAPPTADKVFAPASWLHIFAYSWGSSSSMGLPLLFYRQAYRKVPSDMPPYQHTPSALAACSIEILNAVSLAFIAVAPPAPQGCPAAQRGERAPL